MFFHITELEHHPIQFDVTYAPGEIDLGSDLRQAGDLRAAGSAELLKNTEGEIRVRGRASAALISPCSRCLEDARSEVDTEFDLFNRPALKLGTQHVETRLEEGEEEIGFYEGDGLALEEILREFVILQLPMRVFCRPDCLGLCPECGVNRNENPCSCATRRPQERWAGLNDLV